MSGIRQAALCIHGLSPRDQKWILKNLPRQQRTGIKGMLRELKALGIPAGQGWLPELEKSNNPNGDDSVAATEIPADVRLIEEASFLEIKKLLLAESDEFIASVLSVRQWSWEEQLMSILSKKRKMNLIHLKERRETNKMQPRATTALISVIAEQLEPIDSRSLKAF